MPFDSPTAVSSAADYRPFPLGEHRCEAMFASIEPFPAHCFPKLVEQYLQAQAVTQNCHVASVALPVLSVLASAIGSTRRLRLQANWVEPAVLWTATVAEPALLRSPPLDAAIEPLRVREEISFEEYETRLLEYQPLITRYRRTKRHYTGYGKVPIEPPEPVVDRYLASEWNLKSLHLPQPCVSVTGAVDPHLLVRKLTKAATPCVLASRLLMAMPVAEPMLLSDEEIDADTQLGYDVVVGELLRLPFEHKSREFIPLVQPPHEETDEIIRNRIMAESLRQEVVDLKQHLAENHNFYLPPCPPVPPIEPFPPLPAEVTRPRAAIVEVSKEAKQKLSAFLQEIAILKREIDPALAGWLANLPKQTARLALVLHLTRHAAGEKVDRKICDAVSMEKAITLATWFANEAIRIVAVQSICSHDKEIFEFTDWLALRGGHATPREVCRSLNRRYPTFEDAIKIMQKLVDTRVAVWKMIDPGPQGGRPVHYLCMGISPVPPADHYTYEDTWDPHPQSKPEPAKPAKSPKKGDKKPMTKEDWDEMYPVSDEFRALLRGEGKGKSD